jgi:hypothetical protein
MKLRLPNLPTSKDILTFCFQAAQAKMSQEEVKALLLQQGVSQAQADESLHQTKDSFDFWQSDQVEPAFAPRSWEAAHQAKAAGVVDPSPGDDDSFDNEDVEPITVDPSSHANHGAIIFGCVLVVVGLMVTLASVGYIIAYGPVVAGIAIIVRAVRAKSR